MAFTTLEPATGLRVRQRLPLTELLLLLVALFWGTSYGLTKQALAYTGVYVFIALRFWLTFALLCAPLVRDLKQLRTTDVWIALPTGIVLLAIFSCEVIGVAHTRAANAAVLISLSVLFTLLLEHALSRQPLQPMLLVLVLLSVTGVGLLTAPSLLPLTLSLGDGLILLAALLRAFMIVLTQKLLQRSQITPLSLTALQSAVVGSGAMLVLLVSAGESEAITLPVTLSFWGILGYLVICCTLFAFFVQNYAVQRTSPTRVSLLMGSEPLFGALFAVTWLGERLSLLQWLGAVCILLAVLLTTARTR